MPHKIGAPSQKEHPVFNMVWKATGVQHERYIAGLDSADINAPLLYGKPLDM